MSQPVKKVRVLATGLDAVSAAPYVNMPAEDLEKLLLASIEEMKSVPNEFPTSRSTSVGFQ